MQRPSWYSSRVAAVGIGVLAIGIVSTLTVSVFFSGKEKTTPSPEQSNVQPPNEQEPARVYIEKFTPYRDIVDADTRSNIETILYGYAYVLKGNDLYTAVVRKDSYVVNRFPDDSFDFQMLVDVKPIDVTYKISVIKDRTTNNQQGFLVTCAPKPQQKDNSVKCIDEEGR